MMQLIRRLFRDWENILHRRSFASLPHGPISSTSSLSSKSTSGISSCSQSWSSLNTASLPSFWLPLGLCHAFRGSRNVLHFRPSIISGFVIDRLGLFHAALFPSNTLKILLSWLSPRLPTLSVSLRPDLPDHSLVFPLVSPSLVPRALLPFFLRVSVVQSL